MSRLKLEIRNWHRTRLGVAFGEAWVRTFSSQFLISSFQFLLLFIFSFAATTSPAQEHKWRAPMADCCFEMKITGRPTDPSAGIVAIVPDCGLLPKNQFKVEIFDENGKILKHEFLWHNPKEGLAVVFEPTESENVFLYVSAIPEKMRFAYLGGAGEARGALFRPSLLLYVRNGNAGLEQAHNLAEKPPVGNDIFFTVVDRVFHSLSPAGRDDNASSYYTGWFNAPKPGKTYFYTSSKDGSEFFIDGKLGYSWPGIHGRDSYAEKGQWINMAPGPHRIEYFHFNASFAGREAHLGWQLPGEQQVDDPKVKGRKNLDVTGPMQPDDFIRSGRTELKRALSKKGPLAFFSPAWEAIIQPGKDPVCLFRFEPFGAGDLPKTAACSWDFGNTRIVKGESVFWLFGGYSEQKVSLNISAGGYNSTATRSFFPKSRDPANEPPRVSILTPEGRAQFRAVYQAMVAATPNNKRPCEDWNETMWEGFAAVLDRETDPAFFSAIVERSGGDLKRVAEALRWKIEDRIIEITRRAEPKKASAWVDLFEKDEKDTKRIAHWKAKKIEIALYELNDLAAARVYAGKFTERRDEKYSSALRLIRLGDVERFGNNLEAAGRFYLQAQELYAAGGVEQEAKTAPVPNAPGSAPQASPTQRTHRGDPKAGSAGAKTQTASKKQKERQSADAPPKKLPVSRADVLAQSTNDWKTLTVQEAAHYATVQNLIDQDACEEARATLDQWELEFPITKLTGDYLIAEALYYIALDNYRAAASILANYCSSVEISNELPRSMRMELFCLTKMNRDKEARALARAIIERLPRHELADEMRNLLAQDDSGPLMIDFDLHTRQWTASEKVDSSGLARLFATNKVIMIKTPEGKEENDRKKSTDNDSSDEK